MNHYGTKVEGDEEEANELDTDREKFQDGTDEGDLFKE